MTRFWIFCIFTMFATACSVPSSPQPEAWPQKQARISLQESDYLDLGLRVLALEMTQSAGGQRQYYLQYLPRMGHIEATVRFEQNAKAAFSAENRSFWQQRIETETQAIHIGVKELIEGLALAKGFDPKRHIWIRFQTQGENLEEIALMNPKGIQWLQMSLPE